MKKTMLALGLFIFIGTANAAKIESIYLDKQTQEYVNAMGLQFSIHTERIKEDEEEKAGSSYYTNYFRTIDRMIFAQIQATGAVPYLDKYLRFRDESLAHYDRTGTAQVYGYSLKSLAHFLRQAEFVFGGFKR